jgi:hypothetical protein
MRFEIASQTVAQCHPAADPDQHRVHRAANVLRKIPNAPPDPLHVKPSQADRPRGQQVDGPVPAVKPREAAAHQRNQLDRSGQHDDRRRNQMCHHG